MVQQLYIKHTYNAQYTVVRHQAHENFAAGRG